MAEPKPTDRETVEAIVAAIKGGAKDWIEVAWLAGLELTPEATEELAREAAEHFGSKYLHADYFSPLTMTTAAIRSKERDAAARIRPQPAPSKPIPSPDYSTGLTPRR